MAERNKRLEKYNSILVSENKQELFEEKLIESSINFYINPDKTDEYVICGDFIKAKEILTNII